MIEPKTIELMNLAVDGVASPRERAELEKALAADPSARSYYESLTRVVEKLNHDPMPEPPTELEPRILDAVQRESVRRPVQMAPVRKGFFSYKLRPWSTFGLGLAAGVLIFAAVQQGRSGMWNAGHNVDPGSVSGSIVSDEHASLGSIPIDTEKGTVSGGASIEEQGSNVVVRLRLQSTVPVEWHLDFDGTAWALLKVEREGNGTAAFAANRSSVQGLHTGEGGVTLVFSGSRDAAQAVVLKLLEAGNPVFEGRPSATR
jgi:anti-sigma factor RsiW